MESNTVERITTAEMLRLGALDSHFFGRQIFPQTIRQDPASFHPSVWRKLDGPSRYVNIQIFRGGAKTSLLRVYGAKRIGYGVTRTMLYIGKSEGHAIRSSRWLRRAVEHNKLYNTLFKLRPGSKWQDDEFEIIHGIDEYSIWVKAVGITGSIRGINFDDYRPDLIIVDDIVDEENAATPEQRQKITSLIYGAVKESLAPETESPLAKLVVLQTPLNKEDFSTLALDDPEWDSAVFGCWTESTKDLPLERQISSWLERYPSETLRKEKQGAAHRNQLSIFLREKECRIVSPETSAFNTKWLKYWDVLPEKMTTVLAIDPVPPPSEAQLAAGLRTKDFEVLAVVGKSGSDFFLLDYVMKKGHEPSWTIAEFFSLALKWRPRVVKVEGIAYQRTLAWLLKQAMDKEKKYYVIDAEADIRKKTTRIIDALSGIASNGHFHVSSRHVEFISAFSEYPDVAHDDILDAVAMAVTKLSGQEFSSDDFEQIVEEEEEEYGPLDYIRGAP